LFEKAINYEAIKKIDSIEKAIVIYQYLIKTKQGNENLIARLRLARLYIQYKQIPGHYSKALEQLAILEKTANPSYLVFTYYMHAIMYAHGYGVEMDNIRALAYHKKYQQLLDIKKGQVGNSSRIKISSLLQDIVLTPPDRLKQIINNLGQPVLNWKDKNNIPESWQNKPFCRRNKYHVYCHNPDWSISDCQKVFYNDQINNNLCSRFQCNDSTQPCFELINVNVGSTATLFQNSNKKSVISGYLKSNSRYITLASWQSEWKASLKKLSEDTWIDVMWCETGPVLFLNQCQGDTQTGHIKSHYLKLIEQSNPVKWIKK